MVASTEEGYYIAAMSQKIKNNLEMVSDIPAGNWIDRIVPKFFRAYCRLARLDRPIGTWLLLLPCWWGCALASSSWPDWRMGLLFGLGAVLMRGAGCTLNDLADRKFDARVARTSDRPLANGEISVVNGVVFVGLQLLLALWILLQFNMFAIKLGIASLLLVFIYPFTKRFTYWPQFWLGLTFNWGVLLGWAAVRGDLAQAPWFLYFAGILWTLGYDTIYAHQDKEDDLFIGVKSSALALGSNTIPWLILFYAGAIVLVGASGYVVGLSWPFFIGLLIGALHLGWQVKSVDIDHPRDCLLKFKSNRDFGFIILLSIITARVL